MDIVSCALKQLKFICMVGTYIEIYNDDGKSKWIIMIVLNFEKITHKGVTNIAMCSHAHEKYINKNV